MKSPNLDEFLKKIKNHRVICFGRSEAFLVFSRMMKSFLQDDRIEFIADNDSEMWGTFVPGYDKKWRVCPPDEIEKADYPYIIVITVGSSQTADIIAEQLSDKIEISSECIIHSVPIVNEWIENKKNTMSIPDNIRVYNDQRIPKVIHYCWFGKKPIPERYLEWMGSWKRFCPDYEIVRWDESNYDISKNKYIKTAYDAGKYGFVSDFARLDILYNNGGIYFDTDVEIIKPIDDFLYEDGFAGYLLDERIATGLGIGAVKGLSIIEKLMEDYDKREFINISNRKEKISVQLCSEIQTEYLLRNPKWKYTNGVVNMDGLRVYPPPVFDGLYADEESRNHYAYTIHHYAGSWLYGE